MQLEFIPRWWNCRDFWRSWASQAARSSICVLIHTSPRRAKTTRVMNQGTETPPDLAQ
jgi:hypothetical protein